MKYFLNAWKNYNVTEGRSTRAEFWAFYGITIGVMVVQMILASALYSRRMDTLAAVVILSLLVHVAPYFSLIIRRLHDIGLSSWFSLFIVVPFFLQLILQITNVSIYVGLFGQSVVYSGNEAVLAILVVISFASTMIFGLMNSKPGMNKYGPNPKEVAWAKNMQESAMNGQQFQNGASQQFNNMGQQFQNGASQQFNNMGQQFQNGALQQFNNMGQPQFQNEMPQQFNNIGQPQFQNEMPQQFSNMEQQFQNEMPQQFTNMEQPQFNNEAPQQFVNVEQPQFQNGMPQQFSNMDQQFQNEMPQQFNNMEQPQFNNEAPQQFVNVEQQQFQNEMPQQHFENQNLQSEVTVQESVVNPNSEELAKFEKMYQEGILTQEEFEGIKNRLTSN